MRGRGTGGRGGRGGCAPADHAGVDEGAPRLRQELADDDRDDDPAEQQPRVEQAGAGRVQEAPGHERGDDGEVEPPWRRVGEAQERADHQARRELLVEASIAPEQDHEKAPDEEEQVMRPGEIVFGGMEGL